MEHETFDVLTKFQSFGLFVGGVGPVTKGLKAMSHAQIQNCCVGVGGVVQGRLLENSLTNVFFFIFISLFYSLQRGSDCLSMVLFQRKLLFQGFRGSSIINPGGSTISQGSNFFPGWGIQMLFSIEAHITCCVTAFFLLKMGY